MVQPSLLKRFKVSHEIIRVVAMMSVRFTVCLRTVEYFSRERGEWM